MDDPTRRCENDTDNETHSPRPPIPSGGLIFSGISTPSQIDFATVSHGPRLSQPQRSELRCCALTLLEDESLGWRLSR
jgi:hypothetical protein